MARPRRGRVARNKPVAVIRGRITFGDVVTGRLDFSYRSVYHHTTDARTYLRNIKAASTISVIALGPTATPTLLRCPRRRRRRRIPLPSVLQAGCGHASLTPHLFPHPV